MPKYQNNIFVAKTDSGKRHYTSAIPSDIPVEENVPYIHKARLGDRWDTLAYKFLGAANLWYAIAAANNQVNGSIFVKPGTLVTIPEIN